MDAGQAPLGRALHDPNEGARTPDGGVGVSSTPPYHPHTYTQWMDTFTSRFVMSLTIPFIQYLTIKGKTVVKRLNGQNNIYGVGI